MKARSVPIKWSSFLLACLLIASVIGLIEFQPGGADASTLIEEFTLKDYIEPRIVLSDGKYDVLQFTSSDIPILSDASVMIDENGVPFIYIDGEKQYNPNAVAFALEGEIGIQYSSQYIDPASWKQSPDFEEILDGRALNLYQKIQELSIKKSVFVRDQEEVATLPEYRFDYTYNGICRKAPFVGSFAQQAWIQACMAMYNFYPCTQTFEELRSAMAGYALRVEDGGFTYEFPDGSLWFEEIPLQKPAHILNAQIVSLLVLQNAIDLTGLHEFDEYVTKGREALESRFFDYYDGGAFARYDLNYRLYEQMFRISTFTGKEDMLFANTEHQIFISSLRTKRKDSPQDSHYICSTTVDEAFLGALRLAGNWGEITRIGDISCRGTVGYAFSNWGTDVFGLEGNSFFMLEFPLAGKGNPVIEIEYYDNEKGTLTVDMRNPHKGNTYDFFPIYQLETQGDKRWKTATIEIPIKLLTSYIGPIYHLSHLMQLDRYQRVFQTDIFDTVISQYAKAYLYDGDEILGDNFIEYANIMPAYFTPTYDNFDVGEYGVQALFDQDVSTNAGAPWGQDATLEGVFAEPMVIRALGLVNYSKEIAPQRIDIYAKANVEGTFDLAYTFTGDICTRQNAFFRFPEPFEAQALKFVFSDFKGQDRFVGRELQVFADTDELYAKKMLYESLGADYMARGVSYNYIDVLKVGQYIYETIQLGVNTGPLSLKNHWENPVGQCGDKSYVFIKLLNYLNIPAKTVTLYNTPIIGDGHATAEFFMYNKMNYIDTSFNFYVATPKYPFQLKLLQLPDDILTLPDIGRLADIDIYPGYTISSLADIVRNPSMIEEHGYHQDFVFWLLEQRLMPLGNPYRDGFPGGDYLSEKTYKMADPVVYSDGKDIAYMPIEVRGAGVAYGDIDEAADPDSFQDMINPGTIPSGLYFVGRAGQVNFSQKYILPQDGEGKIWTIEIVPSYCTNDEFCLTLSGEGIELISENAIEAGFSGYRQNQTSFVFIVRQTDKSALVYIDDKKIDGQYIYVDAIRVTEETAGGK